MVEGIFYIVVCFLTGLCGTHRRLGFLGTFLAALVFTPVAVLILLLLTGPSHRVDWVRRHTTSA